MVRRRVLCEAGAEKGCRTNGGEGKRDDDVAASKGNARTARHATPNTQRVRRRAIWTSRRSVLCRFCKGRWVVLETEGARPQHELGRDAPTGAGRSSPRVHGRRGSALPPSSRRRTPARAPRLPPEAFLETSQGLHRSRHGHLAGRWRMRRPRRQGPSHSPCRIRRSPRGPATAHSGSECPSCCRRALRASGGGSELSGESSFDSRFPAPSGNEPRGLKAERRCGRRTWGSPAVRFLR